MTQPRTLPDRTCVQCGAQFRPRESSSKFCRIDCAKRHRRCGSAAIRGASALGWAFIEYRCVPVPEAGCFLWLGATGNRGYGRINGRGYNFSAHRAAWEVTHGPIPAGLHVMHVCDTPICVNPAHLRLGTHAENMADRQRKGRTTGRGKRLPSSPYPIRKH